MIQTDKPYCLALMRHRRYRITARGSIFLRAATLDELLLRAHRSMRRHSCPWGYFQFLRTNPDGETITLSAFYHD